MTDLQRSVPFEVTRAEEDSDGLTLEGYAAVFDTPTEIDSWEGSFTEKVRRGAFRKTIRERTPVMQFDHGRHPLIGSIPIGTITQLQEDDRGLFVSGRLSDNWLIEPVRQAISDGAVDGMSFRFSVVREEWRDSAGVKVKPDELGQLLWDPGERGPLERTLIEVKMAELGPVVFPAYSATTVGVRARGVADEIARDEALIREVRRSLAQAPTNDVPVDDPELRREVARAILFGIQDESGKTPEGADLASRFTRLKLSQDDDAPLPGEHSSDVIEDRNQEEQKEDAPLPNEHPSGKSRIDPARIQRDAEYRTEYLQLIMKGSAKYGDGT